MGIRRAMVLLLQQQHQGLYRGVPTIILRCPIRPMPPVYKDLWGSRTDAVSCIKPNCFPTL